MVFSILSISPYQERIFSSSLPLDSFIREFSLISLLIPSVYRIFVSRANRMNYIPPRSDKHFTSVQLYYFSLHGWLVIFSFFLSFNFPAARWKIFINYPYYVLFHSLLDRYLSRSTIRIFVNSNLITFSCKNLFCYCYLYTLSAPSPGYNIHGFPPLQGLSERLK